MLLWKNRSLDWSSWFGVKVHKLSIKRIWFCWFFPCEIMDAWIETFANNTEEKNDNDSKWCSYPNYYQEWITIYWTLLSYWKRNNGDFKKRDNDFKKWLGSKQIQWSGRCSWVTPPTILNHSYLCYWQFFDVEDNIWAHKSDCDEDSVVSDASSTSSGVRWRVFCQSRTWKEKKKKQHKPKGNRIMWLDLSQNDENKEKSSNLSTYLLVRSSPLESDLASRYDSWIRGVPNDVASEIKTFAKQA